MRIAIDAIPLLLRSAGVKTYVYNWFRSLRRVARSDEVVAWPFLRPADDYSHEESVVGFTQTLARLAFLHAANYSGLPLLDWVGPKVDFFHASQQLLNPPRKTRLTATLYDMTCWLVPETHSPRNVKGSRVFAERVVRRADGLIAISNSTRDDAVRILGLSPDRIAVIYPGVAEPFFQTTPNCARVAAAKYGLSRPYVLFVGTIEPRKNIDALLEAFAQLPASLRSEFELVLAGPAGWANPETLARLRSPDSGARYLGYVPEQDLPGLTAGATVFVYPSLYEGFGLPLGQAMAAGVPLITSNVSSMPEVAGDAALLVDPRSPSELAAAMQRLLLSPGLRAELAQNGISLAKRYTWETCARQSLEFFRGLRV
ncbi:MAG: glycosyltransferase family 1 protein [Acidobacteriales bacterium]|nr:MAG: glycosyltransferase family 1 protein [Terriglobales bacterium]